MNLDAWKASMREINSKMESHKEPYTITVNGLEIDVFPNVYSPFFFTDSEWFSKNVSEIVGKNRFLEIGSGTGIISLSVALNGARVTMVDINPNAVRNSEHNFQKYGLTPEAYLGDIYGPIPSQDKFDFIFWNHPFNKGENPNESILFKSGFDYQYKSLRKYISEAHLHLTEQGKLLLGTGKYASLDEIEEIAKESGYNMNMLRRIEIPVSQFALEFDNDYRIYEFQN